jgi:hypothetical protein
MKCPKCGKEAIDREPPRKSKPYKGCACYIHKERWVGPKGGFRMRCIDDACWVEEGAQDVQT